MILKDNKSKKYVKNTFENKIICGETLSVLKKIPANSVQTIITSPSYFLQKEYENYSENELMFGKLNICQYAKKKYFDTFIEDLLGFKNFYFSVSILGIFALIILIIFYYIGFLEKIIIYLADGIMKIFNLDIYEILSNTNLYGFFTRLNSCKGHLGTEIIKFIV